MSTKFNSLILRALQNKLVLDWWRALEPWAQKSILQIYADRMKWPIAEVNPEMTGEKDIQFLLDGFPSSIRVYAKEIIGTTNEE